MNEIWSNLFCFSSFLFALFFYVHIVQKGLETNIKRKKKKITKSLKQDRQSTD